MEGQPIETRPPEKSDNKPAFPEQTRAPYHASAPFQVTTLIDNLPAPWSLAFLPDGKILLTERLPGSLRILSTSRDTRGGANGVLSEPVAGVAGLASPAAKDVGLLDVVLDPHFAANHQIFFTFFDFVDGTNSNTYIVRARLDEAKCALSEAKVIFRSQPAMPSKLRPRAHLRLTIRSSENRVFCLRSGPMARAARKAWHSIREPGVYGKSSTVPAAATS
jgi:glucose/arabinose dehydrogenase